MQIMIIVFVTFPIPSDLDPALLKEKFLETAPIYQQTPGLLRKNYIADAENHCAGGVYCFDTMENAQSWFDEERIAWITQRYSKPDLQFFENPVIVDNDNGQIIS
tara:strand:- start:14721 stop:15035 length:315 start_codon:yes stop_codon:yes gene_type:complete